MFGLLPCAGVEGFLLALQEQADSKAAAAVTDRMEVDSLGEQDARDATDADKTS